MRTKLISVGSLWVILTLLLTACQPAQRSAGDGLRVLAVESFLADITQNVAGERVTVETLIPNGLDPHAFEPTPRDTARIAGSDVLVINGAGFEEWLAGVLENAGGERLVIEASQGLKPRESHPGEEAHEEDEHEDDNSHAGGDPHFWLNPLHVITYVENIRDGLTQADPEGSAVYAANAEAYIAELRELDDWIQREAAAIPAEQRKIVTNHESFGYFAEQYGFEIIGTVIPSASSEASPSAQQMAGLVDRIRATGARAIFLETGANPQLAEQIAHETGIRVVTDLYTHSLSDSGGDAPNYLDMMRYNTRAIVEALK